MDKFKKIIAYLLFLVILLTFAGCSETQNFAAFKPLKELESFNGKVLENQKYIFEWEEKNYRVILRDKQNGEIIWSSIPNELCETVTENKGVQFSPINVSYLEPTTNQVKTLNGNTTIENVSVQKLENGIKVYYCFDASEICVPVTYMLDNDGISVEVNSKELTEGKYRIYQITLLPYMASVKNSENKDNWLFVPYGSGALMYTDAYKRAERKLEESVYGIDFSVARDEEFNTDSSIKLPVFAAGNAQKSIFAVIESGAEYASITALAGNKDLLYSNIAPSFNVRGYNVTTVQYSGRAGQQIVRVSDTKVEDVFKIKYHIIEGNKNFAEMASIYRKYLDTKYGIQNQKDEQTVYLNFVGGASTIKYTLGVKHSEMTAATTFNGVNEIIEDFKANTKLQPLVNLSGFGKSGVDFGEISGGYKFNKAFGSKKDLEKLIANNKVLLDSEIIRFSKSGNGISSFWDTAKNANNGTVKQYFYNISTKVSMQDKPTYRLLKRDVLFEAAEKVSEFTEKYSAYGADLGSIGNMAYSDYASSGYTAKGKIDEDISGILKKLSEKGIVTVVSDANDYAAATSSIVIDAPLDCGTLNVLDLSVPFYSMVFKGYTSLYSKSLNLSSDLQNTMLNLAVNGAGIQYTVCNTAASLRDTNASEIFAQSVYSDIKDGIYRTVNQYKGLAEKLNKAKIKNWYELFDGVTVTEFDNGIKVYCNYTNSNVQTPCGEIESLTFAYSEGR